MRQLALLLIGLFMATLLFCQQPPPNDDCHSATLITLDTPSNCAPAGNAFNSIGSTNIGATPTTPFPLFLDCFNGGSTQPGSEVWFRFEATSDVVEIILNNFFSAQMVLFEGESCLFMTPIACSVNGDGIYADVTAGQSYYLLVAGADVNDQSDFILTIISQNRCTNCLVEDELTLFPPPVFGTYAPGTSVNFCYTIKEWMVTGTVEWLHSVTLDLGPGWDYSSITPTPPPSCDGSGQWDFYDFWISCNTGIAFGPGFAYDSQTGIGCGGFPFDNDPGNNWGDGSNGCSQIGQFAPPVTFCWTIDVRDDASTGTSLNTNIFTWTDGDSGSWTQTGCNSGNSKQAYLAVNDCTGGNSNAVTNTDDNCSNFCGGTITVNYDTPAGQDYLISIYDEDLNFLFQVISNQDSVQIDSLCAGEYLIVTTLSVGCQYSESITIEQAVSSTTIIDIPPTCQGDSFLISGMIEPADPLATYYWTGPDGTEFFTPSIETTLAGIYTLIVTDGSGCTRLPVAAEAAYETFLSLDFEGPNNPSYICLGDSIRLFGEGAVSYNWGPDYPDTSSIWVMPEETTEYTLTGVNDMGCTDTARIEVTVFDMVLDLEIPEPDEPLHCIPFFYTLNANVSGTLPPITFYWEDNQPTTTGTSGSTIYNDEDYYDYITVTAENNYGCSVTDSIFMAPELEPVFDPDLPDTIKICNTESLTLTANEGSMTQPALFYQWDPFQTTQSITLNPPHNAPRWYSVAVNYSCGTRFDSVFVMPINTPDLSISGPTQVCAGQQINLIASGAEEYEWSDGSTNDTLSFVATADTSFTVIGTSSGICTDSISIDISVFDNPDVSIEGNTTVCQGDLTTLTAFPAGLVAYQWSNGDTGQSITINPAATSEIGVTVVNEFGCFADTSITITVAELPLPPVISCNPSLTSIEFNWPAQPGLNYEAIVLTGQSGILNGNTFIVDGLIFNETVTVQVIASDANACVSSAEFSCTTVDCPNVSLSIAPVVPICADGTTAPFNLSSTVTGGGGGTLTWSGPGIVNATSGLFDPSVAGIGIHIITLSYEEGGCSYSTSTTIVVDELLSAPQLSCEAALTSITFNWDAIDQASDYSVNVQSGQTGTLNGTSFTVSNLDPATEVCIEVIANSGNACPGTSAMLCCMTEECPDVLLDVTNQLTVCANDTAFNIPLQIIGGNGSGTVEWAGPCITDAASGLIDPAICGIGTHTLIVTYTQSVCSYSETINLEVLPQPISSFEISVDSICQNEETMLVFTGSASPNATYNWDFDGGIASPGTGPGPHTISWSGGGLKVISLTLEDMGCQSEIVIDTIVVDLPLTEPVISCQVAGTSSILFTWTAVPDATAYEVNVLTGQSGVMSNQSMLFEGLQPEETVEVEVIALSNGACGNSTAILACTTAPCPTVTVQIADPGIDFCLDGTSLPFQFQATVAGGQGNGTFIWTGPGITDPNFGIFDPAIAGPGNHTILVIYDENACAYQAMLIVTVNGQPDPGFSLTSDAVCTGDSILVTYTGNSNPDNFIWFFDGGAAQPTGPDESEYWVSWPTAGSKMIGLQVTENTCTSDTLIEIVDVFAPLAAPNITCFSSYTTITLSWSSVPGASAYELTIDGMPFSTTATSFTLHNLIEGQVVDFTLQAVNSAGVCSNDVVTFSCATQACADLLFNGQSHFSVTVCEGNYFELCLPDALSYTWDGPSGYFSIDQCLVWPDFDPQYAGEYVITAVFENNCTVTATLELVAPPALVLNDRSENRVACPTDVFWLFVDYENAVQYQWFPISNVLTPDSAATLAYANGPTLFTVQAFDEFGCYTDTTIFVGTATNCTFDPDTYVPPLGNLQNGGDQIEERSQEAAPNNLPADRVDAKVYPNPAYQTVFIEIEGSQLMELELYDGHGRMALRQAANGQEAQITVDKLPAGAYWLKLVHEQGVLLKKLILLQP